MPKANYVLDLRCSLIQQSNLSNLTIKQITVTF